jgi:o-succinylbenzoate synthase
MITIQSVAVQRVALPLRSVFRTRAGVMTHKAALLVRVETTNGVIGWGEASMQADPGYMPETLVTGEHILRDFLIPLITGATLHAPDEVPGRLAGVRGHPFAKAGLEAAIWDAFGQTEHVSIATLLARQLPAGHAPRPAVEVGAAVGLQATLDATLQVIQQRIDQGYARVKLKIKPGQDLDVIAAVRGHFPDLPLMADANSAYTLADADHLARLDAYDLLMIEQPLAYNDLYEHAQLAQRLQTPVCLDESVTSLHDWRLALHLHPRFVLNLKPGRVGGLTEALRIYRHSIEQEAGLWVGGMLETGVGRASALALAALPGMTYPGDIGASDRYFEQDIVTPPFTLDPDGTLPLPDGPGIGVQVML